MTTDPTLTFVSKALESGSVETHAIDGVERLASPFELFIEFSAVEGFEIETRIRAMVGARAHVAFDDHRIHGIVSEVVSQSREPDARPRYRARLLPRLSMLAFTNRARVFHDRTVQEIIRLVLEDSGLTETEGDWELRLSEQYDRREYIVQYEESDLAFLSRVIEAEGISYHFEHREEREHLIFTDSNRAFHAHDPQSRRVPYAGHEFRPGLPPTVFTLECDRRLTQQGVAMVDYDWRKPMVPLLSTATIDAGGKGGSITTREHFIDEKRGARLVKIRAEEARVAQETFRAMTNIRDLHPGQKLELTDHPLHEWDRSYLVVEVRHHVGGANVDEPARHHRNELVAIDAGRRWRPPRATPKPRIDGVHYATIDGVDNGVAAPIDDKGRYRVIVPFANDEDENARATLWVRRAQPLSGSLAGMHFPLLVGTEVLLAYVDGDPDRPVIVGAMPNALLLSPVTSANATQSIIRSTTGITVLFDDDVKRTSE